MRGLWPPAGGSSPGTKSRKVSTLGIAQCTYGSICRQNHPNFATVVRGSNPSNVAEPLPQTGAHLANGKEMDTETRLAWEQRSHERQTFVCTVHLRPLRRL